MQENLTPEEKKKQEDIKLEEIKLFKEEINSLYISEDTKKVDFFKTLLNVLLQPYKFFSKNIPKERISDPILFGTIIFTIIILVYSLVISLLPSTFFKGDQIIIRKTFISFWLLSLSPLVSLAVLCIFSVIFHCGLWLAGARQGIKETFRVIGYSSATALVLLVILLGWLLILSALKIPIPILGLIAAFLGAIMVWVCTILAHLWPLIVLNIGFKHLQKIGFGRAIGATLISIFLALVILVVGSAVALTYLSSPKANRAYKMRKGKTGKPLRKYPDRTIIQKYNMPVTENKEGGLIYLE